MKAIKYFVLINFFLFCGCNKYENKTFENGLVKLSYPVEWEVKDINDAGGDFYYMSLEVEREKASGLWVLTWVKEDVELEEALMVHKEKMREMAFYQHARLAFSPVVDDEYYGKQAKSTGYSTKIEGLSMEGRLVAFKEGDRVVIVLMHGAVEDRAYNARDFGIIANSLQFIH